MQATRNKNANAETNSRNVNKSNEEDNFASEDEISLNSNVSNKKGIGRKFVVQWPARGVGEFEAQLKEPGGKLYRSESLCERKDG